MSGSGSADSDNIDDPLPAHLPRPGVAPPRAAERAFGRHNTAGPGDSPVLNDVVHQHLAALVERVFHPVSSDPVRSVAFTGIDARSSAITAAAAVMLSQRSDATVCVVDANFAAPSLHEHFGTANAAGLSEAIDLELPPANAAHQVRSNLWLVTAGHGPRPSFASEAARVRMAQFIAGFDFVLVDLESVTGPGEGTGLSPLLSGVILVIAADATRRESARRATRMLSGSGASVIGAVLTNRRFPIPDALYRRL